MAKQKKHEQAAGQADEAAPEQASAPGAVAAVSDCSPGRVPRHRYQVQLQHHERTEHVAASQDEAWELYKRQHGILASVWLPEIVLVGPAGD